MSHAAWLEQAELYAAGALDGVDVTQFEAHLAQRCPLCEALVRETREALTAMLRSLTLVKPPAQARAAVLNAIGGRGVGAAPRWSLTRPLAWGMGALVAAGLLVAVLKPPSGMMVVQLNPMPDMPPASAQVMWDPKASRGILTTERLPMTPEGQTYQLWALAGGVPMPAGTFSVDEQGCAQMKVPRLPSDKRIDTFAITMEPAGGMPQPSGPMYLKGSV